MKKVLTQEQLNQIIEILNDLPISQLNRVQAIIGVINEAESLTENQDESNTED